MNNLGNSESYRTRARRVVAHAICKFVMEWNADLNDGDQKLLMNWRFENIQDKIADDAAIELIKIKDESTLKEFLTKQNQNENQKSERAKNARRLFKIMEAGTLQD